MNLNDIVQTEVLGTEMHAMIKSITYKGSLCVVRLEMEDKTTFSTNAYQCTVIKEYIGGSYYMPLIHEKNYVMD